MKKAFTLVELLLVIALMGIMGTLAVGGYAAVTRGMSERAALAAARSVVDAAFQRAQIDRTKTYLFLFNEVIKVDSDTESGIAQGIAVAVRQCGRVSMVSGNMIYDEFGDLDRAFKSLEDDDSAASDGEQQAAASTMRIYKLGSNKSCVNVEEGFYSKEITDNDLSEATAENPGGNAVTWTVYGFKKVSGADFNVGDAYGQEFAVTRLPPGYTFSSSVSMSSASDLGQRQVKVEELDPDGSAPSVTVYARRPNGTFESIGSTGSVKDVAQQ